MLTTRSLLALVLLILVSTAIPALAVWGENLSGGVTFDGQQATVLCSVEFEGDLIVGGRFDTAGSTPVTNVARWDGSTWTAVGYNLQDIGYGYSPVSNLTVVNGVLYATGSFQTIYGASADFVARWNNNTWEALAENISTPLASHAKIKTICEYDGDLYIGGEDLDSSSTYSLARWVVSGWVFLPTHLSTIESMVVHDEVLWVCGRTSSSEAVLAKMDTGWGTVMLTEPWNTSFNDLCVHNGGLYIGGSFTEIDEQAVHLIARWTETGIEPAYSGVLSEGFWFHNGPEPTWITCYVGHLSSIGGSLYAGGLLFDSSIGQLSCKVAIDGDMNLVQVGGQLGNYVGWGTIWPITETFCSATGSLFIGGDFNRGDGLGHVLGGLIGLPMPAPVPGMVHLQTTLQNPIPNPFNPQTTLRIDLTVAGPVRLEVFDLRGHSVKLLADTFLDVGQNRYSWNGTDQQGRAVPSGTYFALLTTSDGVQAQKLLLAK